MYISYLNNKLVKTKSSAVGESYRILYVARNRVRGIFWAKNDDYYTGNPITLANIWLAEFAHFR